MGVVQDGSRTYVVNLMQDERECHRPRVRPTLGANLDCHQRNEYRGGRRLCGLAGGRHRGIQIVDGYAEQGHPFARNDFFYQRGVLPKSTEKT